MVLKGEAKASWLTYIHSAHQYFKVFPAEAAEAAAEGDSEKDNVRNVQMKIISIIFRWKIAANLTEISPMTIRGLISLMTI